MRAANDGPRAARAMVMVMVMVALVDRDGREAAGTVLPVTLAAGKTGEISAQLAVANPHLWQGTADPRLYDLVVWLADANGQSQDAVHQPFGIRTMAFDPDRGFLLNGQPYRLRGVGYHQDRDGKGWAISRADVAEDIVTIREMGANTIRLTHYQHGPDVHDLADRAGIVVCPTALATCCEGRLFAPGIAVPITAPVADLGGANRYFGKPDELGPHLDALRARRTRQPLALAEYGAGGGLTIHTDNVLGAPADSRRFAQPEEYQSFIHETALAQLDARPWLYATWLWNSFDFATTVRTEGDAQDINTKGLVAYDHKTRKDAFYFYKANWNPAPMVHITGKRHAIRAYPAADVKVYSNTGSTELLLNGRSLGTKRACPQMVCVWNAVRLDEGANALVARGTHAAGTVEDSAAWTLSPETARHMVIDAGALVAGKGQGRVLGSDNWFKGGSAASLDQPADYGRPAVPTEIARTQERAALATYRTGTFSYRVPVADGRYAVTLWFATPSTGKPGTFEVKSGRKVLLRQFLPAIPAAGAVAEARTFTLRATGTIALDFIGDARVSLIEIERLC